MTRRGLRAAAAASILACTAACFPLALIAVLATDSITDKPVALLAVLMVAFGSLTVAGRVGGRALDDI